MSEITVKYKPNGSPEQPPKTLNALRRRNCALGIQHEDYEHPTGMEVKALRELMGLTQRELASLTGVCVDKKKDSSTVRKWESPSLEKSRISTSAWELMLLKAGVIPLEIISPEATYLTN